MVCSFVFGHGYRAMQVWGALLRRCWSRRVSRLRRRAGMRVQAPLGSCSRRGAAHVLSFFGRTYE